jgi:hypothetical protein
MASYQERFEQNYNDVNELNVLVEEVAVYYTNNGALENYQLLSNIDDRILELS